MYLDRLVSSKLAILGAPLSFARRLMYPDLVSFGLLANLSVLVRQGLFRRVDGIIDVGANIGQYAYMAHSVLPVVPIHSFEPDPYCFARLERTFARFSIPGRCTQLALSDHAGTSEFRVYENRANNSMLRRNGSREAGERTITVPCSTLDLLEQAFAVFDRPMLKLDVQGYELAVINGAKSLLKRCAYVHLEASSHHSYEGNAHISELFCVMRENGFRWIEILDILRLPKKHGHHLMEADLLFINGNF